jgi:hypothetical protein
MTFHNNTNNSGSNPPQHNLQNSSLSTSNDIHHLNNSNLASITISNGSSNPLNLQGGATSQISSNSVGASAPKATRPKSVCQWSVVDVQKWLRRQCGDYYHLYSEAFLEQDITGRSLTRLSENSLLRLGVVHPEHRQEILRKISKLRLRSNILLLRDMERRQQNDEQQIH